MNSRRVDTARILNVDVDNLELLVFVRSLKHGVVFPLNLDQLIKLQKDEEFFEVYRQADYVLADSQVLVAASRLLGTPLRERVSGSDVFPAFCEWNAANPEIRIFLLGGSTQELSHHAREVINKRIGRDIVVGAHSPPFGFEQDARETGEIVKRITDSRATVLAVGVGAPKQEKWIFKNRGSLDNVKIFLAVGATINFEAGVVRRAPPMISNLGMEWLYRMFQEPKRLSKRYLIDDMPFFYLLAKQLLGIYKNPFEQSSEPVSRK